MTEGYTATGLRILRSPDGSLLIADAGWKTGVKMSFHLNAEMLNRAQDDREAALMFRQLCRFLQKHHDLT